MEDSTVAFLRSIISAVVTKPEEVSITRIVDDRGVLLTLTVSKCDIPTVIGKEGKFAQSVRTILRTFGSRQDALIHLKIITD